MSNTSGTFVLNKFYIHRVEKPIAGDTLQVNIGGMLIDNVDIIRTKYKHPYKNANTS